MEAASLHVSADLSFLDRAEDELLADGGAALASLAPPVPPSRGSQPDHSASATGGDQ